MVLFLYAIVTQIISERMSKFSLPASTLGPARIESGVNQRALSLRMEKRNTFDWGKSSCLPSSVCIFKIVPTPYLQYLVWYWAGQGLSSSANFCTLTVSVLVHLLEFTWPAYVSSADNLIF